MITFLSPVFAQSVENPVLDNLRDMSPVGYFSGVIPTFFALIIVVGIIIFLFFFLLGAVDWITSGGDKMKIERSRSRITTALIGLIILLSFIAIISLIETFFGIGFRTVVVGPYNIRLLPPPTQMPNPSLAPPPIPPTLPPGLPPGSGCTSDSQCMSGYCNTTTDADGDTYHTPLSSGTGVCDELAPDCNDSAEDLNGDGVLDGYQVHPDQYLYFQYPIPGTTNDFDYDCNNGNDKWPSLDCLAPEPHSMLCQTTEFVNPPTGFVGRVPECGELLASERFVSCFAYSSSTCSGTARYFPGCNRACVRGYNCGDRANELCQGWEVNDFIGDFYSTTRMPCK